MVAQPLTWPEVELLEEDFVVDGKFGRIPASLTSCIIEFLGF